MSLAPATRGGRTRAALDSNAIIQRAIDANSEISRTRAALAEQVRSMPISHCRAGAELAASAANTIDNSTVNLPLWAPAERANVDAICIECDA